VKNTNSSYSRSRLPISHPSMSFPVILSVRSCYCRPSLSVSRPFPTPPPHASFTLLRKMTTSNIFICTNEVAAERVVWPQTGIYTFVNNRA
jgi:hypothetical protein